MFFCNFLFIFCRAPPKNLMRCTCVLDTGLHKNKYVLDFIIYRRFIICTCTLKSDRIASEQLCTLWTFFFIHILQLQLLRCSALFNPLNPQPSLSFMFRYLASGMEVIVTETSTRCSACCRWYLMGKCAIPLPTLLLHHSHVPKFQVPAHDTGIQRQARW